MNSKPLLFSLNIQSAYETIISKINDEITQEFKEPELFKSRMKSISKMISQTLAYRVESDCEPRDKDEIVIICLQEVAKIDRFVIRYAISEYKINEIAHIYHNFENNLPIIMTNNVGYMIESSDIQYTHLTIRDKNEKFAIINI